VKYPADYEEAKRIQLALRPKLKTIPLTKPPRLIAGVDAAFTEKKIIAAACLYTFPELIPIEDAFATENISFPYIPGLLSFREGPAIIRAIQKLTSKPDLLLCDGQGIAHPSEMGIASHIGILLDIPSIGCAKSRLVGDYKEPGTEKGRAAVLAYHNRTVGTVLRTRENVKPVFVSPGHLIDQKWAVNIVLNCVGKYRLPEPIRRADALSKRVKSRYRG
jgi:deoxyribonuclease V